MCVRIYLCMSVSTISQSRGQRRYPPLNFSKRVKLDWFAIRGHLISLSCDWQTLHLVWPMRHEGTRVGHGNFWEGGDKRCLSSLYGCNRISQTGSFIMKKKNHLAHGPGGWEVQDWGATSDEASLPCHNVVKGITWWVSLQEEGGRTQPFIRSPPCCN